MTPTPLNSDLVQALRAAGDQPLPVIDLDSQHVYVVVDQAVHERAMKALRYHESVESIRRGIEDMEAGRGMTIEESQKRTLESIQRFAKQ